MPSAESPTALNRAPFSDLAKFFLRLGTTAFGRPAAHIAIMEDELVRRRRWVSREKFLDMLGASNLIPGPRCIPPIFVDLGPQTEPRNKRGHRILLTQGVCHRIYELARQMGLLPFADGMNMVNIMKNDRTRWVDQARELRAAGIELEIPEDDWRDPPRNDLIIRQCDGPLLNSVFDMPEGPTGFMVNLRVAIATSGFALAAFDVELPWKANLNFLDDPRESASQGVCKFFNRDIYPRESAIDHYADSRCIRRRGESIEGYLFAWSFEHIPDRFVHGSEIPTILKIFDQSERPYQKEITLWADRIQKRSTLKRKVTNRKPIFEEAEAIPDTVDVKAGNK
jgi:Chromate transporter